MNTFPMSDNIEHIELYIHMEMILQEHVSLSC